MRDRDLENQCMDTKEGREGRNLEIGIDIYIYY